MRVKAWGEPCRESGVTNIAPQQGTKWTGMDCHTFSEGVRSEVLSPGGLQAQAHFATC